MDSSNYQELDRNSSDIQRDSHSLMQAQIARNNDWIEKMSPVIKYKIQEYVRKQRAKKQQRRKFSIACGLPTKHPQQSTSKRPEKRNRRVYSERSQLAMGPPTRVVEQQKVGNIDTRRKSAPSERREQQHQQIERPQHHQLNQGQGHSGQQLVDISDLDNLE